MTHETAAKDYSVEAFWKLPDEERVARREEFIRHHTHKLFLEACAKKGWWILDEKGRPFRLPIYISDKEAAKFPTMAHLLVYAKLFESVGQAKKAGWNKPVEHGTFDFKGAKVRLFVGDEL